MKLRGKRQTLIDATNALDIGKRKKGQENIPSGVENMCNVKRTKGRESNKNVPKKKSSNVLKKPKNVSSTNVAPITRAPTCCFGFDDSDLFEDALPCTGALTRFDCSKPYRLALYVRPSKTLRLAPSVLEQFQKLNPSMNLTNMTMNSTNARPMPEAASSPDRTQFKVPFASTPKEKPKGKLLQMKITDVFTSPKRTRSAKNETNFKSYFENSITSDEEEVTPPAKLVKKKVNDTVKTASANASSEDRPEPVTFRKPNRRSYIKKPRPPPEPEDTTPTDQIIKSMEKAKKKGKSKKAEKEEEEFEKWSRSMNCMFDEIDQFEMSIN